MPLVKKLVPNLKALASKAIEVSFIVIVILMVQKILLLTSEQHGINWKEILKDPQTWLLGIQLIVLVKQAQIMHRQAEITKKVAFVPLQERRLLEWLETAERLKNTLRELKYIQLDSFRFGGSKHQRAKETRHALYMTSNKFRIQLSQIRFIFDDSFYDICKEWTISDTNNFNDPQTYGEKLNYLFEKLSFINCPTLTEELYQKAQEAQKEDAPCVKKHIDTLVEGLSTLSEKSIKKFKKIN